MNQAGFSSRSFFLPSNSHKLLSVSAAVVSGVALLIAPPSMGYKSAFANGIDNAVTSAVLEGNDAFATHSSDGSLRVIYTRSGQGGQFQQNLDLDGVSSASESPTSATPALNNFHNHFAANTWYTVQLSDATASEAGSIIRSYSYNSGLPAWSHELPTNQHCRFTAITPDQNLHCVTDNSFYTMQPDGQLSLRGSHSVDLTNDRATAGSNNTFFANGRIITIQARSSSTGGVDFMMSVFNSDNGAAEANSLLVSSTGGGIINLAANANVFATDGNALFVSGTESDGEQRPFLSRIALGNRAHSHHIVFPAGFTLGNRAEATSGTIDFFSTSHVYSYNTADLTNARITEIRGGYFKSTNNHVFTADAENNSTTIRRYSRGINSSAADAPVSPPGLRADVYSSNALELFWEEPANAPAISTYEVRRNNSLIAIVGGRSYFDEQLTDNSYEYSVTAISSTGLRSTPAVINASLANSATDQSNNTNNSDVMNGISVAIYSSNALELFWDRQDDSGYNQFDVYRNGALIGSNNGTSFFDSQLPANTTYNYRVVATHNNGQTQEVGTTTVTAGSDVLVEGGNSQQPGPSNGSTPVTNLRAELYSSSAAELFWAHASAPAGIANYEISRDGQLIAVVDGTSYFDASLVDGNNYVYAIAAVDTNGNRLQTATIGLTVDTSSNVNGGNSNNGTDGGGNNGGDNGGNPTNGGSNPDLGGPDTDGDGIRNQDDLDDDNDGIPDSIEGAIDEDGDGILDGNSPDTDGDGTPDAWDLDSDNDGILDNIESQFDRQFIDSLDFIRNGAIDLSYNVGSNGIADVMETYPDSGQLIYHILDRDADGIYDFRDLDADNDGIYDIIEAGGTDADANGTIDNFFDGDDKGVDDQIQAVGLPIFDTDGDGGADFRDPDSDNDTIPDFIEAGSSPSNPRDTDGDGAPDYREQDSDGDGVPDFTEIGSSIAEPVDSNGDGIADYLDANIQYTLIPLNGLVPTTPTNLRASIYGGYPNGHAVEVLWNASRDPDGVVNVYQVYRDGEPFASIEGHSYLDERVINAITYTYTVQALDNDKNRSKVSAPLEVLIPESVAQ